MNTKVARQLTGIGGILLLMAYPMVYLPLVLKSYTSPPPTPTLVPGSLSR